MKPTNEMTDKELIRYIEGQSLILNEFGMKTEFHIQYGKEENYKYFEVTCPKCHGCGEAEYYDEWEEYEDWCLCSECDGSGKVEIEAPIPVYFKSIIEFTNFTDCNPVEEYFESERRNEVW